LTLCTVVFFAAGSQGSLETLAVSRLDEDRYRGTANGYLNAAVGFGALIAGITGGYIWQQFSDATGLITRTP